MPGIEKISFFGGDPVGVSNEILLAITHLQTTDSTKKLKKVLFGVSSMLLLW